MSKRSKPHQDTTAPISRRNMVGTLPALPIVIATTEFWPSAAYAQSQPGPKASVILRRDLEGQGKQVQESMLTIVEFPPAATAPRHMHPAAQEIFYLFEGTVTVEVEGQVARTLQSGEALLIPADVPHLVRNDSTVNMAKGIAIHSRGDKSKPLRIDLKPS